MNVKPLKVVVTRKLPSSVEKRMSELFDADFHNNLYPMSYEELKASVQQADVLVPSLGDKVNEHVLSSTNNRLKLIANYGAGFDHIDIKAAIKKGIIVSNTTVIHNDKNGYGGLSGSPLKNKANEKLSFIKKIVGDEISIIASGGVMSASDYLEKINAGADLVQIYTGFIFEGPKLIQDILLLDHS